MNEMGFLGPAIDITILRPAFRTLQAADWSDSVSARTTLFGCPNSLKSSSSSFSLSPRSIPGSSSENSTRSNAFGVPVTKSLMALRKSGCLAPRLKTFWSTSSTAVGLSFTICWTVSSASSRPSKWQIPRTLERSSGLSFRRKRTKNARVPSEPTKSCARFSWFGFRLARL